MKESRAFVDRVPPRQQTEWDIRGALNFIFGGAGGGLLAATALAAPFTDDPRPLILLGLALVAAGMFAVWLKIGRPWRALNVFRQPGTSWMSREAMIATVTFAVGAIALLGQWLVAILALGLLGLAFTYAQGRILKANIGISAWRRWSCVSLVVATGLVEGVSLVCVAMLLWPGLRPFAFVLAALVAIRYVLWRKYLDDLRTTGAPTGALEAFAAIEQRFVWIGHAVPLALALVAGFGGFALVAAVAGVFAIAAGAWFKYILVCRAAFTQGFSLPRTPRRGGGTTTVGVQHGWRQAQGQ
jgi:phenylacetyl-CoA:acceptor oxidoreductase 26-kDa subunit